MAKEKSLVEEAIIQMKNLEEAVAENAKGILASTMSQEIKELVKESLTEQEEEEIDTEVDMDDMDIDTDMDDTEMDDIDVDMDMDDDMDTDNIDMEDDEDTIDLTDVEDDEEILRVFQLMGPEDNIVVTKDDSGNINVKDEETDKEYMIVGEGEEEFDEEVEEEMYEGLDDSDDMEFDFEEEDMDDDDSEGIEDIISRVFDNDDEDSEMDEEWGGNKHDFKRRDGHKIGDVDGHFKDFESEFDEEEEMDDEEIVYEISFDDEEEVDMDLEEQDDMDMEDETMMESKMSVKPKGTGMGKPKFTYDSKPNQGDGFNTKMKEGQKTMGTGKAKFTYKDGENAGSKLGKNKMVKKTETKEQTTKIADTTKKVEPKEASRTLGNGSNFRKGGLPKPRAHSSANTAIKENTNELRVLREKNEEYRKALNVFRNKLNEVAVFNSNLAYATRLFTEHSTSKQEKINILRRFDGVENIKESKNLYKIIKDELTGTTSQPMNESLERTIAKAPSTGSAINLIESKTYENPQFLRMKDLMSKLK